MTSKYDKFLSTYTGKRLLQHHSLEETGTWQVFGEDPNCDVGGPHIKPDLGTVEGKLGNVIEYAVEHKDFWQWGAGGDIKKITIQKIDSDTLSEKARLRKLKQHLEDELFSINQRLGE